MRLKVRACHLQRHLAPARQLLPPSYWRPSLCFRPCEYVPLLCPPPSLVVPEGTDSQPSSSNDLLSTATANNNNNDSNNDSISVDQSSFAGTAASFSTSKKSIFSKISGSTLHPGTAGVACGGDSCGSAYYAFFLEMDLLTLLTYLQCDHYGMVDLSKVNKLLRVLGKLEIR